MISPCTLLFGTATAAGALVVPPALADTGFPSRRWVKIVFVNTGERFNNLYIDGRAAGLPSFRTGGLSHRSVARGGVQPFVGEMPGQGSSSAFRDRLK